MNQESQPLLLFPFGGNAREALQTVQDLQANQKRYQILGFVDDDPNALGHECCGFKVLGGREIFEQHPEAQVLAVPGGPKSFKARKALIDSLNIKEDQWATLIHPCTKVASDARVGKNTLIMQNCTISTGVSIGDHCVVLPNTVVSHDASIGNYTLLGSNISISGHVAVGENCYLGTRSCFRENVRLGNGVLVGIGGVVLNDFEDNVVCVGNPARKLEK